ncbi:hypothetical protein KFE25_006438 [Diacronema lutheri]|uniref:Uncharacterized protein n=1 Tax=Diacronema lutheri TaxID=2081491 RepID=A0A8J5XKW7_DIALT|nr:hypothetical protein KFE25_006438 [Diacronema lutheri]
MPIPLALVVVVAVPTLVTFVASVPALLTRASPATPKPTVPSSSQSRRNTESPAAATPKIVVASSRSSSTRSPAGPSSREAVAPLTTSTGAHAPPKPNLELAAPAELTQRDEGGESGAHDSHDAPDAHSGTREPPSVLGQSSGVDAIGADEIADVAGARTDSALAPLVSERMRALDASHLGASARRDAAEVVCGFDSMLDAIDAPAFFDHNGIGAQDGDYFARRLAELIDDAESDASTEAAPLDSGSDELRNVADGVPVELGSVRKLIDSFELLARGTRRESRSSSTRA